MPSPFRTFLAVACALYLSGAHWMVLQVTAWTGMLVARAPQAGVVEAVESTFDGQHPCRMCVAVKEGQKEERKHQPELPALKKLQEVKLIALDVLVVPARIFQGEVRWPHFIGSVVSRMDAPPTPPPLA